MLEIRNRAEQTVALDDVHAAEIKEYLDLLDLTREIDVLHLPDVSTKSSRTVIAQPGLRYAQADALIRSLLLDETFSALSLAERTAVQQRILTEIKGRMLETSSCWKPSWQTPRSRYLSCNSPWANLTWWCLTRMQAPAGFSRSSTARKLRRSSTPSDRRAKMHPDRAPLRPDYWKFVLYRGENQVIDGIQYQNVEEYLRSLV